jgi:hypothetical protein
MSDSNGISVYVSCFNISTGDPADGSFSMDYIYRDPGSSPGTDTSPGPEAAYVWVWDPSTSSYDADSGYSWNSTGGNIRVDHTTGTGFYTVTLDGQSGGYDFPVIGDGSSSTCGPNGSTGGNVAVTAYGSSNAYCKVGGWYNDSTSTYVGVYCFDGTTHDPTESPFVLRYSTQSPSMAENSGYAWTSDGSASSYTVDSYYSTELDVIDDAAGCPHYVTNNDGSLAIASVVHGSQPGTYAVTFPWLGKAAASYPTGPNIYAQVTAYGSGPEICTYTDYYDVPNAQNSVYSDAVVDVSCYNAFGLPADTVFSISLGVTNVFYPPR